MRTTLDIAEDVLMAAREIARRSGKTAGQVLSELAREALHRPPGTIRPPSRSRTRRFLGFEPFVRRGGLVTDEIVNRLRAEDADG